VHDEIEPEVAEKAGRDVLRHSILTFGTRMGIVLVNIPTSILVARLLGTAGQGTYASAIVFPAMFAFIALLGIDSAHTFLLSKKRYPLTEINGQTVILTVILSAIITPAYILFVKSYRGAATPEIKEILILAAALVPILLAKYFSIALMLGLQRIRWFNLANLVQALVLLAFMCVNLFVVHGGVRGAVIAYLVSEVTACSSSWPSLASRLRDSIPSPSYSPRSCRTYRSRCR